MKSRRQLLNLIPIVIAAYGAGNALRGRGYKYLPKLAVYIVLATLVAYITQSWVFGIVWLLTDWLCFSFGWGRYFPHGQQIISGVELHKEDEFPPSDYLATRLVGKWRADSTESFIKRWQTVAMSLRFYLTFGLLKPLTWLYFGVNSTSVVLLLLTGLLYLLIGGCYYVAFRNWTNRSVLYAEVYTGVVMGAIFALQLYISLIG